MITAILLSGGTGSRMTSKIPKQYIQVNNKPIIYHSLLALYSNRNISNIQIVADEAYHNLIMDCINAYGFADKFLGFSAPGENRQLSIINALQDVVRLSGDSEYVFIHDAARPILRQKLIDELVSAVRTSDGAIPVLPMKDTVYLSEDRNSISGLLDRSKIYAGQAPEIFKLDKYIKANEALENPLLINGSTEPAIMYGMDISMIPGDERNFKITTDADLERFISITR